MKKSELTSELRRPYSVGRGYGSEPGDEPGWGHITFVVPPPPPKSLDEQLPVKIMAEAARALTVLPAYSEMDDVDRLLNYLFMRREAVQSSRMEGTWSTIDEVLSSADLSEDDERTSSNISVRGYAQSIESRLQAASSKKEKVFSLQLIQDLHREIVTHDPKFFGTPGEFRKPKSPGGVVIIGGLHRKEDSIYNPVLPKHIRRCLAATVEWLRDEALAQHGDAGLNGMTLPARLAVAHAHFEAVHPFSDGNGRVGRALWPLQMVAAGHMPLYLSGYIEREKSAYVSALEFAQKKLKFSPLIELISTAIIAAEGEMRISRNVLEELPRTWRRRVSVRKNSAAERTLRILLRLPVLSANDLKDELGCSFEAANNALRVLQEAKILRERTSFRRNRVFAAEEVLAVLSRDFGSNVAEALAHARRALRLE